MNVLALVLGLIVIDLFPASLITFLIRFITKKKISKGWCVLVFIASCLCSGIIALLITGKVQTLGFLDLAVHWVIIARFLYDKTIPSILDTEKELKEKRNKEMDANA